MLKEELVPKIFNADPQEVRKLHNDEAITYLLGVVKIPMTSKSICTFLRLFFGIELSETHVRRICRKLKERNYVQVATVSRAVYYKLNGVTEK